MHINIQRELLLKPLQSVASVVDKKHHLAILANVLISIKNNELAVVGTDLETQLVARSTLHEPPIQAGQITVPARKLLDIVRTLPENACISLQTDAANPNKCYLKCGRSRFVLTTMPAADFPEFETEPAELEFKLLNRELKQLFDSVAFSMAVQDVRYYLNGMLLVIGGGMLTAVATDGHRLSMAELAIDIPNHLDFRIIVPRKVVAEISKLIGDESEAIALELNNKHIKVQSGQVDLQAKLIEGQFPNYSAVIPQKRDHELRVDRGLLSQALQRVAVLFSEKFHGVRFHCVANLLRLSASNMEQEEAQEEIEVAYAGPELEVGFNVRYLMDILAVLEDGEVTIKLQDANSSAVIASEAPFSRKYIVMPMKL